MPVIEIAGEWSTVVGKSVEYIQARICFSRDLDSRILFAGAQIFSVKSCGVMTSPGLEVRVSSATMFRDGIERAVAYSRAIFIESLDLALTMSATSWGPSANAEVVSSETAVIAAMHLIIIE